MSYIFLPHHDETWLHLFHGKNPVPVTLAPGSQGAKYFLSTDKKLFACLDQARKRITVYKLLDSEPWFEKVMSPLTLARSCLADDVLIHNQIVYVGGRSRKGECLWRKGLKDSSWTIVPLPKEFPVKNNKSIDLLFLDGEKLIAIDDVVLPKWILTYDISNPDSIVHLDTVDLNQHTSYESVTSGADNKNYIALISGGINHGEFSQYVSLLDKKTLNELLFFFAYKKDPSSTSQKESMVSLLKSEQEWALSMAREGINVFEISEEDWLFDEESRLKHNAIKTEKLLNGTLADEIEAFDVETFIEECGIDFDEATDSPNNYRIPVDYVYRAKFLDKYLLISTSDGLYFLDVSRAIEDNANIGQPVGSSSKFRKIKTIKLVEVNGFVSNPIDELSVFVLGRDANEKIDYEEINLLQINKIEEENIF